MCQAWASAGPEFEVEPDNPHPRQGWGRREEEVRAHACSPAAHRLLPTWHCLLPLPTAGGSGILPWTRVLVSRV